MYREFYVEIGKLLHAVADIDGAMTQKEKSRLFEVIRKELGDGIRDKPGIDPEKSFFSYHDFNSPDNTIESEPAFTSYINFVEAHYSKFDEKMKKVTMYVANGIANAYWKANEDESSEKHNQQKADDDWMSKATMSSVVNHQWIVSISK